VIRPYFTSLLFLRGNELGGYQVVNNATAAFVDTGKAKLIVTNAHVVHAFDEKEAADPGLKLVIGGSGAVLTVDRSWLKDYYKKPDLKLDLATFVVPDDFDIAPCGKAFYRHETWPPARVSAGDLVVIGGFPGDHRSQNGATASMKINVIADPVSSVNDVAFVLADEAAERVLVKIDPELAELGKFGGMSGSPAFCFSENGEHRLVGFLFDTHEGLNAQIRAVHADFICEDGRLDYGLLPY